MPVIEWSIKIRSAHQFFIGANVFVHTASRVTADVDSAVGQTQKFIGKCKLAPFNRVRLIREFGSSFDCMRMGNVLFDRHLAAF